VLFVESGQARLRGGVKVEAGLTLERADEQPTAHPDPAVDAPHGQRYPALCQCGLPGTNVLVNGIDEGPVQVEQKSRRWGTGTGCDGLGQSCNPMLVPQRALAALGRLAWLPSYAEGWWPVALKSDSCWLTIPAPSSSRSPLLTRKSGRPVAAATSCTVAGCSTAFRRACPEALSVPSELMQAMGSRGFHGLFAQVPVDALEALGFPGEII